MRCAIYARYSTKNQDPASIGQQIDECRRWADGHGHTVEDGHIFFDEAKSGTTIAGRLGLERMREAAGSKPRPFDCLLIHHTSRLSRDISDSLTVVKELVFYEVHVVAVSQGVSTEQLGEDWETLFAFNAVADSTSNKGVSKHTKRGLEQRWHDGYLVSQPCYGYQSRYDLDPSRKDRRGQPLSKGSRRVKDEKTAPIVREIYERFAAGESTRAITKSFNAANSEERVKGQTLPYPPPRGDSWAHTALYGSPQKGTGILNNIVYIGEEIWRRSVWIKHPVSGKPVRREIPESEWLRRYDRDFGQDWRIIPQELWDRVKTRQKTISKARKGHDSGFKAQHLYSKHPLSGLIKCGVCGKSFTLQGKGQYRTYGCSSYKERGETECSNRAKVRKSEIERRVFEMVKNELLGDETLSYLEDQIRRSLARQNESQERERKTIEKQLKAESAAEANMLAVIRSGNKMPNSLLRELESTGERIKGLRHKLDAWKAVPSKIAKFPRTKFSEFVDRLEVALSNNPQQARTIMHQLIEKIEMKPGFKGGEMVLVAEIKTKPGALHRASFTPKGNYPMLVGPTGFEPVTSTV
jgi:site-specific DNA recombinase